MKTHNYFTVFSGDKVINTCNTIADNFPTLFKSGEKLLKYFYIFYGENSVFKSEAVYITGNIHNSPYLKYSTILNENTLNGETITAVGIGGESGYISKAQLISFVKNGKITINVTIFVEIVTTGKILSVNFLKMLFNEPYSIKCAMLTDEEKLLKDYDISNLTLFEGEKTYIDTLNLSFYTNIKKNNVLILIDDKPSFLVENLFMAFSENKTVTSSNFCIDTNNNIELVIIDGETPLYVMQPYGTYIDKGRDISLLKNIDEENEFKASADGKCFTIKSGNKLIAYTYIDNQAEIVTTFGDISLLNVICYDVCGKGIAIAYSNGIVKLLNFFNGEEKTINKDFQNIESIKISNDFSFLSVWGSETGYYLHINTDVLQSYIMANQLYSFNSGDNTVLKLFSGNAACYYLKENSFSYMSLSANVFDGTVSPKEMYNFSGFIGKNSNNTLAFCNLTNGNIMALSEDNITKIDVSPSCKYVLVKYNNGVHKLFYFNKRIMSFISFMYKEALPSGEYYFLGDDKLLKISKSCAVYNIIEDKTQILFKKSGFYSGSFNIKEKINETLSNAKITLKAAV